MKTGRERARDPDGKMLARHGVLRARAPYGLFIAGTILLAAHITVLLIGHATFLSNLSVLLFILLGTTACVIGASTEAPEARPLWILLGSGLLLGAVGQIGSTYNDLATQSHTQTHASRFDFFFFAYGIPVLLAICSRITDYGLKILAWLNGAQALIAATLVYLQLFSALPSLAPPEGISATNLMYLNNAENWILVAAVTLRFFSNPLPARRRFYRVLAAYLWVNAIVSLILGYLELGLGWPDGLQDAAWGLPEFALLGAFAWQRTDLTETSEESGRERRVGMVIDNLSPVLFTLAITLMGVEIAPKHRWLGFTCIAAAVTIYGVRAAILQVRYARSQEALTEAMIAAEQAVRAKSLFLANMSHEIRTPMNGILGMTELALSTELSQEQQEFLLIVKSSADRLLAVIEQILDYSKIEAGKTRLDSIPFHLPGVISNVLRNLAPLADQAGLELTQHIASDVPADLMGDPGRLGQVLTNLVGNALKFTEQGEVSIDVALKAIVNDRARIQFSVRDTGIGIALDEQESLFQEFQQAHISGNRLYGGTGLGLAVSKSLVTLMGGQIGLESLPGKGTTVRFDAFFFVTATTQPAMLQTTALPSPAISVSSQPLNILLAEDNLVNQKVAMAMLGKMGHRITLASNGLEALEQWRAGDFDLILMDIQMPEMNGLDATAQIRREEAIGNRVPILAMTASGISEERDRCLAAGMDDFIAKPINSKMIEQMIKATCSQSKTSRI
jgi:signal transduction histidine kinase/ActR/RegA family two-component response regulator